MENCKNCKTECQIKISKTDKNYGKEFWGCPNRCKVWNGWVETIEKEEYHCKKCKKALDVDYEIDHNIDRYGTAAKGISSHLRREFMDSIKARKYTCEKCLHND